MIPADHATHHLVRLTAARHLRVPDLRTELNLDALTADYWPVRARADVLTDLVLHHDCTLGWELGSG